MKEVLPGSHKREDFARAYDPPTSAWETVLEDLDTEGFDPLRFVCVDLRHEGRGYSCIYGITNFATEAATLKTIAGFKPEKRKA